MTDFRVGPDGYWSVTGDGPWPEFTLALSLARRWGIIDTPEHAVRLVNWSIVENEPVDDPGLIVFEPADEDSYVSIEGCSFDRCDPLKTVEWLISAIAEAWEARDE